MSGLAFEEPSREEMKKALAHIDELLADPVKFEKWLDRAIRALAEEEKNLQALIDRLEAAVRKRVLLSFDRKPVR